jgi:hypothetical protein
VYVVKNVVPVYICGVLLEVNDIICGVLLEVNDII